MKIVSGDPWGSLCPWLLRTLDLGFHTSHRKPRPSVLWCPRASPERTPWRGDNSHPGSMWHVDSSQLWCAIQGHWWRTAKWSSKALALFDLVIETAQAGRCCSVRKQPLQLKNWILICILLHPKALTWALAWSFLHLLCHTLFKCGEGEGRMT